MKTFTKILLLTTFCILYSAFCLHSQNLVPNPSFEQRVTCGILGDCPTSLNMICISDGWTSAKGSPDYYNACDSNMVSIFGTDTGVVAVPENIFGFQNASSGNAYVGMITYPGFNPNNPNEREWIMCALINPLIIGEKYKISLKISLADSVNCASNNIGVLFSTVSLNYSITEPLNNFSHFNNNMIIEDTTSWTTIQSSFIADSSYNYMLIGNFYDRLSTDTIFYPNRPISQHLDSLNCFAYYYIDDIDVELDTTNNIFQFSKNDLFRIYPNPVVDFLHINSYRDEESIIKVYNLSGQLFFEDILNKKNIQIDFSNYPDGFYIIQIKNNNSISNKKINVSHLKN